MNAEDVHAIIAWSGFALLIFTVALGKFWKHHDINIQKGGYYAALCILGVVSISALLISGTSAVAITSGVENRIKQEKVTMSLTERLERDWDVDVISIEDNYEGEPVLTFVDGDETCSGIWVTDDIVGVLTQVQCHSGLAPVPLKGP